MTEQATNPEQEGLSLTESAESGLGRITINNNVIAIIAHEVAKKVPGVVELQGSLVDGLAGMIGKKPKDKGIRVEKENEEFLTVQLTVVLEFGVRIPEICLQLQQDVKSAIEDMSGQKVYSVDVVVQGIRTPSSSPVSEGE